MGHVPSAELVRTPFFAYLETKKGRVDHVAAVAMTAHNFPDQTHPLWLKFVKVRCDAPIRFWYCRPKEVPSEELPPSPDLEQQFEKRIMDPTHIVNLELPPEQFTPIPVMVLRLPDGWTPPADHEPTVDDLLDSEVLGYMGSRDFGAEGRIGRQAIAGIFLNKKFFNDSKSMAIICLTCKCFRTFCIQAGCPAEAIPWPKELLVETEQHNLPCLRMWQKLLQWWRGLGHTPEDEFVVNIVDGKVRVLFHGPGLKEAGEALCNQMLLKETDPGKYPQETEAESKLFRTMYPASAFQGNPNAPSLEVLDQAVADAKLNWVTMSERLQRSEEQSRRSSITSVAGASLSSIPDSKSNGADGAKNNSGNSSPTAKNPALSNMKDVPVVEKDQEVKSPNTKTPNSDEGQKENGSLNQSSTDMLSVSSVGTSTSTPQTPANTPARPQSHQPYAQPHQQQQQQQPQVPVGANPTPTQNSQASGAAPQGPGRQFQVPAAGGPHEPVQLKRTRSQPEMPKQRGGPGSPIAQRGQFQKFGSGPQPPPPQYGATTGAAPLPPPMSGMPPPPPGGSPGAMPPMVPPPQPTLGMPGMPPPQPGVPGHPPPILNPANMPTPPMPPPGPPPPSSPGSAAMNLSSSGLNLSMSGSGLTPPMMPPAPNTGMPPPPPMPPQPGQPGLAPFAPPPPQGYPNNPNTPPQQAGPAGHPLHQPPNHFQANQQPPPPQQQQGPPPGYGAVGGRQDRKPRKNQKGPNQLGPNQQPWNQPPQGQGYPGQAPPMPPQMQPPPPMPSSHQHQHQQQQHHHQQGMGMQPNANGPAGTPPATSQQPPGYYDSNHQSPASSPIGPHAGVAPPPPPAAPQQPSPGSYGSTMHPPSPQTQQNAAPPPPPPMPTNTSAPPLASPTLLRVPMNAPVYICDQNSEWLPVYWNDPYVLVTRSTYQLPNQQGSTYTCYDAMGYASVLDTKGNTFNMFQGQKYVFIEDAEVRLLPP